MGRAWARNLAEHPEVEIVGWVDRTREIVDDACSRTGLEVPRIERLADGLDLAPDFVVDVTPPEVHCEVTTAALGHGIPVLGEKPMASSMEEARAMVRASESSGKLYMVSQSRRYNAGLRAFRQAIRANLGIVGILNADFYLGAHFDGFRSEMENPLVLDMAIHTFDAARYLSGADPVAVYAEEFNPPWSWYRGNACASAIFEMTGGLRFTYRGSWCAEGLQTSWESEWRAVGAVGTACWDGAGAPRCEVVAGTDGFIRDTRQIEIPVEPMSEGIRGSLEEFLLALETGVSPNGECHDNIKSLAMVFAAIESANRQERVPIAEIIK